MDKVISEKLYETAYIGLRMLLSLSLTKRLCQKCEHKTTGINNYVQPI